MLRAILSSLIVATMLIVPEATRPSAGTAAQSGSCPQLSVESTFLCVALTFTFLSGAKHEYVIVEWGDGTSDFPDCVGGGHPCSGVVPHTYAAEGKYEIKVTALTSCPGSINTIPVDVSSSPEFPLDAQSAGSMMLRPATSEPLDVSKLGSSTVDWGDGSGIESFEWIDDGSGVLYAPSHGYAKPGRYNVTVRIGYRGAWGGICYERVGVAEAVVGGATGAATATWGAVKAVYR